MSKFQKIAAHNKKKVKYIEIYYKGLGDVFVLFLKYLLNLPNGIAVFSQVHR